MVVMATIIWNYIYLMQLVIITTDIVSLTIVVHGDVYSIQPYVIKFVRDLKQVIGFLNGILVSSTNRTD